MPDISVSFESLRPMARNLATSEKGEYFRSTSAFQSVPFSVAWNANFVETNHKVIGEV
jgi:hypothetical protein